MAAGSRAERSGRFGGRACQRVKHIQTTQQQYRSPGEAAGGGPPPFRDWCRLRARGTSRRRLGRGAYSLWRCASLSDHDCFGRYLSWPHLTSRGGLPPPCKLAVVRRPANGIQEHLVGLVHEPRTLRCCGGGIAVGVVSLDQASPGGANHFVARPLGHLEDRVPGLVHWHLIEQESRLTYRDGFRVSSLRFQRLQFAPQTLRVAKELHCFTPLCQTHRGCLDRLQIGHLRRVFRAGHTEVELE